MIEHDSANDDVKIPQPHTSDCIPLVTIAIYCGFRHFALCQTPSQQSIKYSLSVFTVSLKAFLNRVKQILTNISTLTFSKHLILFQQ